MRITISLNDSLVPQIDARDTGKGRSDVISRLLLRYLNLIYEHLRYDPPGEGDIEAVAVAVTKGLGSTEADILSSSPIGRIALLDVAERAVVSLNKKEKTDAKQER